MRSRPPIAQRARALLASAEAEARRERGAGAGLAIELPLGMEDDDARDLLGWLKESGFGQYVCEPGASTAEADRVLLRKSLG